MKYTIVDVRDVRTNMASLSVGANYIGQTLDFREDCMQVGSCMIAEVNHWNCLRTSTVNSIEYTVDKVIVKTRNTIYELEKVE